MKLSSNCIVQALAYLPESSKSSCLCPLQKLQNKASSWPTLDDAIAMQSRCTPAPGSLGTWTMLPLSTAKEVQQPVFTKSRHLGMETCCPSGSKLCRVTYIMCFISSASSFASLPNCLLPQHYFWSILLQDWLPASGASSIEVIVYIHRSFLDSIGLSHETIFSSHKQSSDIKVFKLMAQGLLHLLKHRYLFLANKVFFISLV